MLLLLGGMVSGCPLRFLLGLVLLGLLPTDGLPTLFILQCWWGCGVISSPENSDDATVCKSLGKKFY